MQNPWTCSLSDITERIRFTIAVHIRSQSLYVIRVSTGVRTAAVECWFHVGTGWNSQNNTCAAFLTHCISSGVPAMFDELR